MFTLNAALQTSYLEDDLLIFDAERGTYSTLNPVAARMFEVLAETGDPEQVHAQLLGEFEVAAEDLRADLEQFLKDVQSRGWFSFGQ